MIAHVSLRRVCVLLAAAAAIALSGSLLAKAADEKSGDKTGGKPEAKSEGKADAAGESTSTKESSTSSSSTSESQPAAKKPKYPPYAEFMREAEAVPGPSLIKMQRKGGTLYAE